MRTSPIPAFLLMVGFAIGTFAQSPAKMSATERSVREFYDSYAEDLRGHKRESIADRYDRRGVYFAGNGRKSFETFEKVKDRYLNNWSGPKSFGWKDVSVEVISKDSVVVSALFEWQGPAGVTFNYSYTGLLIKREGKWRIRLEDESTAPQRTSSN
jgi:Domain of unknown function (DUF4440)